MHKQRVFSIVFILFFAALACRFPQGFFPFSEWFGKTDVEVVEQNKRIESEDPVYELEMIWPNLQGEEGRVTTFNVAVNEWILDLEEQYIAYFEETVSLYEEDLFPQESWLSLDYSIPIFQDDLISVYIAYVSYITGAAHPGHHSRTYNYDLRTGRFLRLEDLFLPEADELAVMIPLVEDALIQRDIGYWEGSVEKTMTGCENWNLLPDGLRINFDEYDVAPYAAGPQSVIIPWADLAFILDPEGPVGRILKQ